LQPCTANLVVFLLAGPALRLQLADNLIDGLRFVGFVPVVERLPLEEGRFLRFIAISISPGWSSILTLYMVLVAAGYWFFGV
jgi:hypothetical protein